MKSTKLLVVLAFLTAQIWLVVVEPFPAELYGQIMLDTPWCVIPILAVVALGVIVKWWLEVPLLVWLGAVTCVDLVVVLGPLTYQACSEVMRDSFPPGLEVWLFIAMTLSVAFLPQSLLIVALAWFKK